MAGFVMLPKAILKHPRLSRNAKLAFCVLLDCDFEGVKIGYARLGERLGLSRQTARRVIRELTDNGCIQNRETVNGKCPSYELLTGIDDDTGTGTTHDTGGTEAGIKSDADPYQNGRVSRTTGGTLSISSLYSSLKGDDFKKTEDDIARIALLEDLRRCSSNDQEAERVMERLERFCPYTSPRNLLGLFRDAKAASAEDPIEYVIRKANYGDDPKSVAPIVSGAVA
jgi:DNA-binding Lrp family transcriptional regulator